MNDQLVLTALSIVLQHWTTPSTIITKHAKINKIAEACARKKPLIKYLEFRHQHQGCSALEYRKKHPNDFYELSTLSIFTKALKTIKE